jgi:hypothetical protein
VTAQPEPDLNKQYELVLEEYRFQVQINWDRAKHFLVFNTATLAAAVALYKTGSTWPSKAGVMALLLLSALNATFGQHSVGVGHAYDQSIRDLKTRLEKDLKLEDYAIVSTPGMQRGHGTAPDGTPKYREKRWGKITFQIRALLVIIAALSALGTIYAAVETVQTFLSPQETQEGRSVLSPGASTKPSPSAAP